MACPIGTCHELNSPNSPRIVINVTKGKLQFDNIESILIQFPTPLLCIKRTDFLPPSHAPLEKAIPSSSVVKTIGFIKLSFSESDINFACPASGT